MAGAPPHIHTGSDGRFRVWDGERFVAIYEPDDHASASAHLQRLEPKRRKRAAETPRELVLEVSDVRAARRGGVDADAEDPERVHLKQFSDGWRVWNPPTRSYVSGPDGAFSSKFEAMARARELTLQAGAASRGGASRAPARRGASIEGGGLFAAREVAAPGQQVGFKFNGSPPAPARVMAERTTADGSRLRLWSDGALTGGYGYGFPGVPIARPRDAGKAEIARTAGWLVLGEAELYHDAEIPKLYAAALRTASRGGDPGDVRAAAAKSLDTFRVPIRWEVLTADRDGHPTTRFGHLPRLGWAGVGVWHERGVYEVLHQHHGVAVGARSRDAWRDAWHDTGFKFTSQQELFKHLAANRTSYAPAPPAKPNQRLQGRRGTVTPEAVPHYADAMPIGRAMTLDDALARPRRRSIDEYDAMSSLRPNGAAARPRRRPQKARAGR